MLIYTVEAVPYILIYVLQVTKAVYCSLGETFLIIHTKYS